MATLPINPTASTPSTSSTSSSSAASALGGSAPSEQMFLQLLVAQIKNQDPLNPTDSTQFVSQLAQFSELEQVIAIRQDADAIKGTTGTTPANGTTDPTTSTSN
jgi:flagellar basal-body rod modification protein FlgD